MSLKDQLASITDHDTALKLATDRALVVASRDTNVGKADPHVRVGGKNGLVPSPLEVAAQGGQIVGYVGDISMHGADIEPPSSSSEE